MYAFCFCFSHLSFFVDDQIFTVILLLIGPLLLPSIYYIHVFVLLTIFIFVVYDIRKTTLNKSLVYCLEHSFKSTFDKIMQPVKVSQ